MKPLIAFSVVPFGHFRVITGPVTAVFMCVSEDLSVSHGSDDFISHSLSFVSYNSNNA